MSRCGCSRSDFSTPRDRGGATIQGCHNCTSGIGDDGADPAYRTCAGRRIRTRPEVIVEPTSTFLRQPLTMRVAAVALEDSPRNTFVMALGKNEKMSVGFGELSRDTIVSLAACDLHNASREAESIELLDNASLSARSIFLSGGYALAVGAIMIASRYLTTHTSPVADPYSRLEVPPYLGCTRTGYRLDEQQTETISAGVYCGGMEAAGGARLNLEPGTLHPGPG